MKPKKDPFIWWIAGVFIVLSTTFILDLWPDSRKRVMHPSVDKKHYSTKTARNPHLAPSTHVYGAKYSCMDCHATFDPTDVDKVFYSAHKDVILEHGKNHSCRTCHHAENKEWLVDIHGKRMDFSKSEQLCAACHGPTFQDWEKGVHGKMDLHWDVSKRQAENKMTCVACHDPHHPKFGPMEPSPGPYRYNYEDEFLRLEDLQDDHHE